MNLTEFINWVVKDFYDTLVEDALRVHMPLEMAERQAVYFSNTLYISDAELFADFHKFYEQKQMNLQDAHDRVLLTLFQNFGREHDMAQGVEKYFWSMHEDVLARNDQNS